MWCVWSRRIGLFSLFTEERRRLANSFSGMIGVKWTLGRKPNFSIFFGMGKGAFYLWMEHFGLIEWE